MSVPIQNSTLSKHIALSGSLIRWLVPLIIIALTLAAFSSVLQNEFVNWDDDMLITLNPRYRGLGWTQLRWMFTTLYMGHYRPLTWITLGFDYLMWGMDPRGYHLSSLLFHCANAVLFYFVALRLLRVAMADSTAADFSFYLGAGFAALVFSLHPLRVESVAWVTARKDVVSALFLLLACLCYLQAVAAEKASGKRWMAAAIIVYAISLLGADLGMTFPVILLILDVYPLRRLRGGLRNWFASESRQVWREKAPFLLLALAAGIIAAVARYQSETIKTLTEHGIFSRLAQVLYGLTFYLNKTIAPIDLSPLHELPTCSSLWGWPLFVSGAGVLGVTVLLLRARQKWPAGLATWICYGVVLAPVLGIAQSSVQLVTDRYSYLGCLSWAVLVGAAITLSWKFWARAHINRAVFVLVNGLAAVVLLWLGTLTWKQSQVWTNSETLWKYVLTISNESALAHNNLGGALVVNGKVDEAISQFRGAVQLDPGFTIAHFNLGNALAKQERLDEAKDQYEEALRLDPGFAGAHYNLASVLAKQGKLEAAKDHFRQALEHARKGPRPIARGPAKRC